MAVTDFPSSLILLIHVGMNTARTPEKISFPEEIKRRGPAKVEARRRLAPDEVERLFFNQCK